MFQFVKIYCNYFIIFALNFYLPKLRSKCCFNSFSTQPEIHLQERKQHLPFVLVFFFLSHINRCSVLNITESKPSKSHKQHWGHDLNVLNSSYSPANECFSQADDTIWPIYLVFILFKVFSAQYAPYLTHYFHFNYLFDLLNPHFK